MNNAEELVAAEVIKKIEQMIEKPFGIELSDAQVDTLLEALKLVPEFNYPAALASLATAQRDKLHEDHAPLPDLDAEGYFRIKADQVDSAHESATDYFGDSGNMYLNAEVGSSSIKGRIYRTDIKFYSDGQKATIGNNEALYNLFGDRLNLFKADFAKRLAQAIQKVDPKLNGWI